MVERHNTELTELQEDVLFHQATEKPFTGKYNDFFEEGVYVCANCEHKLFTSDYKFESGCGWPAFSDVFNNAIVVRTDLSHGMMRQEVVCAHCKGHLGHVFEDGPQPTGLRYCINSAAITFIPEQ